MSQVTRNPFEQKEWLALLCQKNPNHSLELLAIDIDRGWILLPNGGQSLRAFEGGNINRSNWKKNVG